jgi:hypothetical protein
VLGKEAQRHLLARPVPAPRPACYRIDPHSVGTEAAIQHPASPPGPTAPRYPRRRELRLVRVRGWGERWEKLPGGEGALNGSKVARDEREEVRRLRERVRVPAPGAARGQRPRRRAMLMH